MYQVDFTPCEGFGSMGRTATIRNSYGECIAYGHGETDHEAILDALWCDAGLSYDAAFDEAQRIIASSRLHYVGCIPNGGEETVCPDDWHMYDLETEFYNRDRNI